jgi:hypothetical protein
LNLLQASRNSMLKRVSQMNLSVVNHAALHVKMQEAIPMALLARCSKQLAQNAEKSARFLLSPAMIVLCIAATALQRVEDKS